MRNKHQLTTHQSLWDSPILFRGEWIILPNPNTLSAPWLPRTIVLCHTPHTVQITSAVRWQFQVRQSHTENGLSLGAYFHMLLQLCNTVQPRKWLGIQSLIYSRRHPVFVRVPPADLCNTHNMTDLSLLSLFSSSYRLINLKAAVSSCSWQALTPAANFLMLKKI